VANILQRLNSLDNIIGGLQPSLGISVVLPEGYDYTPKTLQLTVDANGKQTITLA